MIGTGAYGLYCRLLMACCSCGTVMPSSGARRVSMDGSWLATSRLTSMTGSLTLPTSTLPLRSSIRPRGAWVYTSRTPLLAAAAWALGAFMTCRNHSRANRAANRQTTTTQQDAQSNVRGGSFGRAHLAASLSPRTDRDPVTADQLGALRAPRRPGIEPPHRQGQHRRPAGLDHDHPDQPGPAGVEQLALAEHVAERHPEQDRDGRADQGGRRRDQPGRRAAPRCAGRRPPAPIRQ